MSDLQTTIGEITLFERILTSKSVKDFPNAK